MSNTNIIHINGKRYDAISGEPIDGSKTAAEKHQIAPAAAHTPKAAHAVAKPIEHHKQQTAKTLMRSSVKKPEPGKRSSVQANGSLKPVKQPIAEVAPKPSVSSLDTRRLRHAKSVPQSKLVSRFSTAVISPSSYVAPEAPLSTEVPRVAKTVPQPSPRQLSALERALEHAESHHQAKPKSPKGRHTARIVGISGAALLLVVMAGLLSWQNVGNVKVRLASSRAGFSAGLPSNRPAGFSLAGINTSPGEVAVQFTSNTDANRGYTLTEKASGWDGNSLRDEFVAPADSQYQTFTAGHTTIYIYGSDSATWVKNGVWYVVDGHGALGTQQLLNLAGSL